MRVTYFAGRSAAACLLRLWVRIPPGSWMSVVSVVCCQVEVCATSWLLVQRSPTDYGASLSVIQKPREWGGPGPLGAVAPNKQNKTGVFNDETKLRRSSLCSFRHLSFTSCLWSLQQQPCSGTQRLRILRHTLVHSYLEYPAHQMCETSNK
jgi:hypothetical protein